MALQLPQVAQSVLVVRPQARNTKVPSLQLLQALHTALEVVVQGETWDVVGCGGGGKGLEGANMV